MKIIFAGLLSILFAAAEESNFSLVLNPTHDDLYAGQPEAPVVWSNQQTFQNKSLQDLRTGEPILFEQINLDRYCFPFHLNSRKLVAENEKEYNQLLADRRGVVGKICDRKKDYEKCLRLACSGLPEDWRDEKKRLICAHEICSHDKTTETCLKEQACTKLKLPPIDFTQKTVLSQPALGNCATFGFKKEIFRSDQNKSVTYLVTPMQEANVKCSGPGYENLNVVIIPKIPTGYTVKSLYVDRPIPDERR